MAGFIGGAIVGGIVGGAVGNGEILWIIIGAFLGGLMGFGAIAQQNADQKHKEDVEDLLKEIRDKKDDKSE